MVKELLIAKFAHAPHGVLILPPLALPALQGLKQRLVFPLQIKLVRSEPALLAQLVRGVKLVMSFALLAVLDSSGLPLLLKIPSLTAFRVLLVPHLLLLSPLPAPPVMMVSTAPPAHRLAPTAPMAMKALVSLLTCVLTRALLVSNVVQASTPSVAQLTARRARLDTKARQELARPSVILRPTRACLVLAVSSPLIPEPRLAPAVSTVNILLPLDPPVAPIALMVLKDLWPLPICALPLTALVRFALMVPMPLEALAHALFALLACKVMELSLLPASTKLPRA